VLLFVAAYGVILSMYGGGFATIPAYLKDVFGAMHVGAIHGRLLTAWSAAGVLGPVLVNYIRDYEIAHGVAKADSYNFTMYLMAALLVVGFISNWLMRPVERHYHFQGDERGRLAGGH
jgi:MFS family permease